MIVILFNALIVVLSVAIVRIYCNIFMAKKYGKRDFIWILVFVFFYYVESYNDSSILFFCIGIMSIFLVLFLNYDGTIKKKIGLSIIYYVIWAFAELLVALVLITLNKDIYDLYYFGSIISKITLFTIICVIKYIVVKKSIVINFSTYYWLMLIVFSIFSMILIYNLYLLCEETQVLLFYIISIGSAIVLVSMNIVFFWLIEKIVANYDLEKQRLLLEQKTDLVSKHIKKQEIINEELRTTKHDFKNHLIAIRNFAKNNEIKLLLGYLDKVYAPLKEDMDTISKSEVIMVDALINEKYSVIKRKNIDFSVDIKIPKDWKLDDYFFYIVMGNLLDNAITAAANSSRKQIDLKIHYRKGAIYICIKNSYSGVLLLKNKNKVAIDNFLTTTGDVVNHGLGLRSVKGAVENLGGNIELEYDDEVFKVDIVIFEDS